MTLEELNQFRKTLEEERKSISREIMTTDDIRRRVCLSLRDGQIEEILTDLELLAYNMEMW